MTMRHGFGGCKLVFCEQRNNHFMKSGECELETLENRKCMRSQVVFTETLVKKLGRKVLIIISLH